MAIFSDLNEVAFRQIKKDREILLNKLDEIQGLLNDLDVAYVHLKGVYEPEIVISIEVRDGNPKFIGQIEVPHPDSNKGISLDFVIGDKKNYNGINDIELLLDSKRTAREHIMKTFPIYFM
jgi:hypothetical protein